MENHHAIHRKAHYKKPFSIAVFDITRGYAIPSETAPGSRRPQVYEGLANGETLLQDGAYGKGFDEGVEQGDRVTSLG